MLSRTTLATTIVIFAMLASGLSFYVAPRYANAQGTNCHTATAAEVTASGGAIAGKPVCDADRAAGITKDAGAAKAYLLSIAKNLRNSQAPPDKAHIDPLNNSFATCAARFLEAYKNAYGPVNVVSAFRCGPRSPAEIKCDRSENGRAGGATNSNHQVGIAMDINTAGGKSSYETLKSFAQANPGYGVTFPWPFYNGSVDKPHMQATNKDNPSCTGVTGTPVTPSANTSLTSPLSEAVRSLFGGNQLNTSQCITSMNPLIIAHAGTVPQSQCLTNGQQPQLPPPPPPPPPQQPASSGSPAAPAQPSTPAQPTASSEYPQTNPTSGLINTNTSSNTNTNGTATSSYDEIGEYLDPTLTSDSIDIATPIDIELNASTSDAIALDGKKSTSTLLGATGTLAMSSSLSVPQTFTSGNLANSPGSSFVGGQNTFLSRLLDTMKNTLLYALNYLKPFGGRVPGQGAPLE